MILIRNKATKEVLRTSDGPLRADGRVPEDLDASLEVVEVTTEELPQIDPETQKLERYEPELPPIAPGHPIRWMRGWKVVALTSAELAERQARAADAQDRQQIKAIVTDLQNGTGTTAQRLARVERALVRLIKDVYR